jgi:hypothetical protein
MASMQVVARVSVGYVETTCTHKHHDNTFGGLFPKPLSDLLFTGLLFKLHERRHTFNVWKSEVKGREVVATFKLKTISYNALVGHSIYGMGWIFSSSFNQFSFLVFDQ